MKTAGIGVDMLEIERMERAIKRHPRILERLFSAEERTYCMKRPRPAEHFAARFAAREAVLKALGIGFTSGVRLSDVSVSLDAYGRPQAVIAGKVAERARELKVQEIALSLSHTRTVAVANAVLISEDTRPQVEQAPDPEQELRKTFKELRSLIDELERSTFS